MQRAYLTASAALRCRQARSADGAAVPTPATLGERHDQVGEPLFVLWWKVRSCLSLPLGPALLPQSLQGQLPCENGEGPCVHAKVVWLLASSRCVSENTILTRADVSPPSQPRALEPLLQERADARERAPALRYDACVEVPRMGHARPYLDFDVASRRFQFLGHADRIVAQDLIAADVDQRRRQPGRVAVERGGVVIAR